MGNVLVCLVYSYFVEFFVCSIQYCFLPLMRVKEINELLENAGGFLDNFVIMFIGLNIASK